jgi:cysteine-rich secretory family protein
MRKLHKLTVTVAGVVTVAAVALSLTLAFPSAAAAESAGDCYAQLNAIRATAGVPNASATAIPALAKAAADHASYRARTDADGGTDPSQHHETSGRPGFTGVTSWDRTKAAGLEDGTWRSQFENVTTTSGVLHSVQSWVDAPYHRFPLLDANNRAAGCGTATARTFLGRTHAAAALEMAATWAPQSRRLTVYPAPGQTGVPVSFDRLRERPAPFPAAAETVGYVVSFQADGYAALKVKHITLSKGANHTPVAIHKAARFRTATTSATLDANLPANAAMLAATRSLDPHTTYHVRVSGSVKRAKGSAWTTFQTRTWSFTTA